MRHHPRPAHIDSRRGVIVVELTAEEARDIACAFGPDDGFRHEMEDLAAELDAREGALDAEA